MSEGTIDPDGTLTLRFETDPGREFAARLRHQVNPRTGIVCGLVFCAALFLVAVQLLFRVAPSVIALGLMAASVVVYLVAALRARAASGGGHRRKVVLDERGIAVADGQGNPRAYAWDRFTRWLEDDGEFVVVSRVPRQPVVALVLPTTGTDFDDELRDLLHAAIDPDDEPIEEAFTEMDWDEEPERRRET
ncbi:hypothetical protein HJ590_05725 [Naumannella sp. ID2617S]|nr:hypothetical protein [Naumannella sp. ID2617S]